MQIIATPLLTVETPELFSFLSKYFAKEDVELILVGVPRHLNNQVSPMEIETNKLIEKLKQTFHKPVIGVDERFTSKIASKSIAEVTMKKKTLRDKTLIDKVSATILLQSYLEKKTFLL